ncbi:MAG: hypothetical protein IPK17_38425 [Chloroflexi bacterium]|uniref:hypothetical protein n=1 Tax=Candidatus Flexifilum breve TaxID=3140694 RepID=UPI0031375968|nr:hypothetical protein [Chloroflexota bacterium]
MEVLAQTDITDTIETILSKPTDVLLAGVLVGFVVIGIIVARAFARWVTNVDKMFARRDEIDAGLMTVIQDTGKAINASVAASKQSASSAERTEQAVEGLASGIKQGTKRSVSRSCPRWAASTSTCSGSRTSWISATARKFIGS